jgi:hypothetical protein
MIKIGDRNVEVIFEKAGGANRGTNTSGSASDWYGKIWLDLDQRPLDAVEGDFWHEVVEMIDKIYNLSLSHQTITCLGSAIHQVLTDNRKFINNFKSSIRR